MPPKWKSGRSALASAAGAAKAAEIADKARARLFRATMVGVVTEWREYEFFYFAFFLFLAQNVVCVYVRGSHPKRKANARVLPDIYGLDGSCLDRYYNITASLNSFG